MSKTADDLIYEAAGILGRHVVGEALGDVEYQTISNQVDNALATVGDIVYLDRDDIPDRLFNAVADIVAALSAAKFSQSKVDPASIEVLEDRLRYLVAPSRTRNTLRIDPAFGPYRRNYYGGR
jgi:hypothetical protein